MDKKTCCILLIGLIFVILLTKNNNYLEGFTKNVADKMSGEITTINKQLNNNKTELDNNSGVHTDDTIVTNMQ